MDVRSNSIPKPTQNASEIVINREMNDDGGTHIQDYIKVYVIPIHPGYSTFFEYSIGKGMSRLARKLLSSSHVGWM